MSGFPPWIPSILTVALILWLTLAPKPLGDNSPDLFPGADKVVHALMFAFLTGVLIVDYVRRRHWRSAPPGIIWGSAAASAALGVAIEYAQEWMAIGRGFETADMAADAAGALLCALVWSLCRERRRKASGQ